MLQLLEVDRARGDGEPGGVCRDPSMDHRQPHVDPGVGVEMALQQVEEGEVDLDARAGELVGLGDFWKADTSSTRCGKFTGPRGHCG